MPENLSRRRYLHSTAVSAGGLLLSNVAASESHAQDPEGRKSEQQESGTLKVALVGCGGRGSGAAVQALSVSEDVELWAMADAFSDRLELSLNSMQTGKVKGQTGRFKGTINVPPERRFIGLDAYRRAIDSGADVVILTGPPGFRPLHFEYAVNAGVHVFMEKPLASDAHGVRRVLASAAKSREKNLKVGVGLQRHHQASYQEAIRRIHEGDIGRIVSMRCFWNGGPPAKTPFPRKETSTELEYQIRNWYFFDWLSGDHICEQHIHNLDICNWVKGEHPVEAEGMGGRQVRTGPEYGNIFDHHAVIYTYADGTKMHSYCRQIRGCKRQVAEEIEGTNGTAALGTTRCSLTSGEKVLWQSPRKRGDDYRSPYQVEWDALVRSIRNDTPHNEADNGAMSTMTAILGRLATYSGNAVRWDKAFESDVVLTTDAESWDAPAPLQPLDDGSYAIPVPGVTKVL